MKIIDPSIAFDNYFDKKKYEIARNFAAIIFVVFIALFFFFLGEKADIFLYYVLASLMMAFCFVFILFSKNYKVVYYIISIGGTVLIVGSSNFGSHSIHYSTLTWSLLTITLAFFGANVVLGKVLTVIHLIGITTFVLFFLPESLVHLQQITLKQEIGTAIELSSNLFLVAYIVYQFVVFHNYSNNTLRQANVELEQKNKIISAKSEENSTLIKEVHHRVKNNLQIITSLLRLQKSELAPETESKFDEAINRIMTMSLIHQKLYQEDNLSKINVKSYILELSNEVKHIFQTETAVAVEVQSTLQSIGLKTVVPFGLLINELISNSFKHAFNEEKKGCITIDVKLENSDTIVLKYSDSGTWKKTPEGSSSFGLELVETLTDQLDGTCERVNSSYLFHLKNLDT